MTSRTAPALVGRKDLVYANNRIVTLDADGRGLTVTGALALAGVHRDGIADVSIAIIPVLAASVGDSASDQELVALGFGLGVALGALAAQNAEARDAGAGEANAA